MRCHGCFGASLISIHHRVQDQLMLFDQIGVRPLQDAIACRFIQACPWDDSLTEDAQKLEETFVLGGFSQKAVKLKVNFSRACALFYERFELAVVFDEPFNLRGRPSQGGQPC